MKDLTQGNIYKNFILFTIPLIFSAILSQSYGFINSAMVGRYIGEHAFAASSATSSLANIFNGLMNGIFVGYSVYAARLFKAKEYGLLKSSFISLLIIGLIVLTGICVTMTLLYGPISIWLNIDDSIVDDAGIYFKIINLVRPFMILNTLTTFLMASMGETAKPFWVSLLTSTLSVGLNYIFIVVFSMGIVGSCCTTVITTLLGFFANLLIVIKSFKKLQIKERYSFKFSILKSVIPFAGPTFIQQGGIYITDLLLTPIMNGLGVAALASWSIVSRLNGIIQSIYYGSTRAAQNYWAQSMGQQQYANIKKGMKAGIIQNCLVMTPFVLAAVIFRSQICDFFLKEDATPIIKQNAMLFLKIYFPFLYFNTINNLLHAFYRSVKAGIHLCSVSWFGALVRCGLSFTLIKLNGLQGAYLALVLSWIIEAVVSMGLYFIGKWKPKDMLLAERESKNKQFYSTTTVRT